MLASCAHENTKMPSQIIEQKKTPRPPVPKRPLPSPAFYAAQGRMSVERGDYERGLAQYRDAFMTYPDDPAIASSYEESLTEIKDLAEGAFTRREYLRAGLIYLALLRNFPEAVYRREASLDRMTFAERIRECADKLTQDGLALYRAGQIDSAINTWRGVLRFDPENYTVRKAIDTASKQLKNLNK